MARTLLILVSALIMSCGAEEGTQGTQTGEACADSNILEQCPPRSEGVLEAEAASNCNSSGSISVDVDGTAMEGSGSGAISQVCVGSGSCRVVCTLADTCEYGVESINDTEGVICRPAPCGNGVCDPGENPENCNADCGGAVCTDGASRCSSGELERCDRQGMWEVTPCGAGQICEEANGSASCVDSDVDCDTACDTLYSACVAESNLCMAGGGGVLRNVYDGYCRERCRDYPLRFEEYLSDPNNCVATIDTQVLLDFPSQVPPFCEDPPPARCPDVCAEACDELWSNCIDPSGRSESTYQCGDPAQAVEADGFNAMNETDFSTSCVTRCCPNPSPYEAYMTDFNLVQCADPFMNGLFECARAQCGNGECEYREQQGGPAECRADCQ